MDENASPERISRLLHRAIGRHEACRVIGPLQNRETAVLFRAEHPWFGQPVMVRVCKGLEDHPAIEAHRRLDLLERIRAAMGTDSRFNVPKPYPLLADNGCEILEWIDGKNLSQILLDPTTRARRAIACVCLAGQWLRRFHQVHRIQPTSIDADRLIKTGPRQASAPLPPVFRPRRRYSAHWDSWTITRHLVIERPVAFSRHHGDFTPENVILTDDRVVGIDFERASDAECLRDIANFLFKLDVVLRQPRGWRLMPFRRMIRRAVLEGYAGGNEFDRRLPCDDLVPFLPFKWLRVHRVLREWALDAARWPSGLRRRYLDGYYRRLGATVLAETAQDWRRG